MIWAALLLTAHAAVPLKLDVPALLGATIPVLESHLGTPTRIEKWTWEGGIKGVPTFLRAITFRADQPKPEWHRRITLEWSRTPEMKRHGLHSVIAYYDDDRMCAFILETNTRRDAVKEDVFANFGVAVPKAGDTSPAEESPIGVHYNSFWNSGSLMVITAETPRTSFPAFPLPGLILCTIEFNPSGLPEGVLYKGLPLAAGAGASLSAVGLSLGSQPLKPGSVGKHLLPGYKDWSWSWWKSTSELTIRREDWTGVHFELGPCYFENDNNP
ncbi:hypothetical protein EON81_17315 [bacterium]|nr:MAG: hypothetical protein EON81_17315 [bacterium]